LPPARSVYAPGLVQLAGEGKAIRGSGEANALVAVDSDARRLIDDVVDTLLAYA